MDNRQIRRDLSEINAADREVCRPTSLPFLDAETDVWRLGKWHQNRILYP